MQTLVRWISTLCLCAFPALLGAQARTQFVDTLHLRYLQNSTDSVWKDTVIVISIDTAKHGNSSRISKVLETTFRTVQFPYEAPSMILHENMHKLAFKAFGVSSKIEYQSFKPWHDLDSDSPLAYTDPNRMQYIRRIKNSGWKNDVVSLAPYAGDLLIKDRLIEALVRKSYREPDWYSATGFDKRYIGTLIGVELVSLWSLPTPFENASRDGSDIARVAARHGINKWLLASAIEMGYLYSSYRNMRTAVCGNAHCGLQD